MKPTLESIAKGGYRLLAGQSLHDLIDLGIITAKHENVNASSIDVRLGSEFYFERLTLNAGRIVDLAKKESPSMAKHTCIEGAPVHLLPGKFCLAHTMEIFNLPNNISALFILRSSMARAGLEHMQAGWADAGWHGSSLTLEFKNMLEDHVLRLTPGMRVGQMVFYYHEDAGENSYAIKGNYNSTPSVTKAFAGQK